eukprot:GHVO01070752.1.p1 GENE.GHVO01070752.1~~GHVO01070752.1.p1  ORF type:complete len:158 (+),score=20.77 GHVO01070752.1:139-612(+)
MGNTNTKHPHPPEKFVVQSRRDWDTQVTKLFETESTMTRTVMLPPGVALNDPRLAEGTVVDEIKYDVPLGEVGEWSDETFEADIDGKLLKNQTTHYAVFPNEEFADLGCPRCQMHRVQGMAISRATAPAISGKAKGMDAHSVGEGSTTVGPGSVSLL